MSVLDVAGSQAGAIGWLYDASRTATTANEIHVPVGRTIQLKLTSADVIHSFWVPSLHGKRDLIRHARTSLPSAWMSPGCTEASAQSSAVCSTRTWPSPSSRSRRPTSNGGSRTNATMHPRSWPSPRCTGAPAGIAELPIGRLDGLALLPDGSFLVTSWLGKAIYHVDAHGTVTDVVNGADIVTPASIEYDRKRGRILIPLLKANQVRIETWPPTP